MIFFPRSLFPYFLCLPSFVFVWYDSSTISFLFLTDRMARAYNIFLNTHTCYELRAEWDVEWDFFYCVFHPADSRSVHNFFWCVHILCVEKSRERNRKSSNMRALRRSSTRFLLFLVVHQYNFLRGIDFRRFTVV